MLHFWSKHHSRQFGSGMKPFHNFKANQPPTPHIANAVWWYAFDPKYMRARLFLRWHVPFIKCFLSPTQISLNDVLLDTNSLVIWNIFSRVKRYNAFQNEEWKLFLSSKARLMDGFCKSVGCTHISGKFFCLYCTQ